MSDATGTSNGNGPHEDPQDRLAAAEQAIRDTQAAGATPPEVEPEVRDDREPGRDDDERTAEPTDRWATADAGRRPADDQRRPRHEEDPTDAPVKFVRDIGDPMEWREHAARTGKSLQAVPYEHAVGDDSVVADITHATADLRAGAEKIQTKREDVEDRSTVAAEAADLDAITADGEADGDKADRLAQAEARAEQRVDEAKGLVARAREKHEAAKARLRALRDEIWEASGRKGIIEQAPVPVETTVPPKAKVLSLLARIGLPSWGAVVVMVIDVIVTTLLVEPSVAAELDVMPQAAYLLAGGLSVGLMVAAGVAGVMLAACRLPVRLVAGLLAVLFVAILAIWVPGLEQLREGDDHGLVTFTASTVLAAYVAFVVAYAAAVHGDAVEEHDAIAREAQAEANIDAWVAQVGTPLSDAIDDVEEAATEMTDAEEHLAACEEDLQAIRDERESLSDSAARTAARAATRKAQTAKAQERSTIRAEVLEVKVDQEEKSGRIALAGARAMWFKTVAEMLRLREEASEVAQLPPRLQTDDDPGSVGLLPSEGTLAAKVAIGALAGGGALGLALAAPLVFATGAGIAAVALLVPGLRNRRPPEPTPGPAPDAPSPLDEGAVVSPAEVTARYWRTQPDRTVSAWINDDADPVERL